MIQLSKQLFPMKETLFGILIVFQIGTIGKSITSNRNIEVEQFYK